MTLVRALLIAVLVSAVPAVALMTAAGSATSVVAPPGVAATQQALDWAHESANR